MKDNLKKDIDKVFLYNDERLKTINIDVRMESEKIKKSICESEAALQRLGYSLPRKKNIDDIKFNIKDISFEDWEHIVSEANEHIKDDLSIEAMFTKDELNSNEEYLVKLRKEFNEIHKLDTIDWMIPIVAGILGGIIDVVLVGIPTRTTNGTLAGSLSNYIRRLFNDKFTAEEMIKLANKSISKTPFDAQDNRNTKVYVEGLSTYYHRLYELGHDPILAYIIGVLDVLKGTMTTIDKNGKIVVQTLEMYSERKEYSLFKAIAKVFRHLKSDVTTVMGLPAPLMGVFNLFQFGSIGEYDQTIADIIQSMYYEGYDFIHFCSMSISTIIIEIFVRVAYAFKMKKDGYSSRTSIAFTTNRENHPKLGTELFLAYSSATLINSGKIFKSKDPLAINYPQWIAFAKYSICQLKWVLVKKPEMRNKYVQDKLDDEWMKTYNETEDLWAGFFV